MLTLVEAFLLTAALYPLLRLYTAHGFRRRLNPLSGFNLLIPAVITGYISVIVLLALFLPLALHPLILAAAFIYLYLFWRARPSYGKTQNLPPGSLALLPVGQWNDPLYYEKRFRTYGPIFKSSDLYRPAVNILGIPRARAFLAQHADAVRVPAFPVNRFIPGGLLRCTAPAQHAVARPVFQAVFNSAVLRDREPTLAETMRCDLANLAAHACAPGGIAPTPYLHTLVDNALTQLFFGINPTSPVYPEWQTNLHHINIRRASRVSDTQVRAALQNIARLLQTHITVPGAPCCYLSELQRFNSDALTDPFYLYNLIYIHQIGRIDLTGLLLWILAHLAENPFWLTRLRDPDAANPSRFVPNLPARIVLETLRLQQSEFIIRQTTRDIQFENYRIPKGWFVRLCIKESHQLSDAFGDPACFNPDRLLDHRFTRDQYMPFGAYNKSCLGEQITLTLAKLFITQLLHHTFHLTPTHAPQHHNGFHWQPSPTLRLHIDTATPSPVITPC